MSRFKKNFLARLPLKRSFAGPPTPLLTPNEWQISTSDYNWTNRLLIVDQGDQGLPVQPAGFNFLNRSNQILRPPPILYGPNLGQEPWPLSDDFFNRFDAISGARMLSAESGFAETYDWALLLPFNTFSSRTLTANVNGDTGPVRDYVYTPGSLKGGRAWLFFVPQMLSSFAHGGYYTITSLAGGVTAETAWFNNRLALLTAQLADFEQVSGMVVIDDNSFDPGDPNFSLIQTILNDQANQVASLIGGTVTEVSTDADRTAAAAAAESAIETFFGI